MGICLSKKKKKAHPPPSCSSSPSPVHEKKQRNASLGLIQKQQRVVVVASQKGEEASRDRKPVFVITPCKKKKQPITDDQILPEAESKVVLELVEKNVEQPSKDKRRDSGLMVAEETRMVPLRASSCTKEEVESILIQCGRLSRSSSGKGGLGENGRRYSGSKRSYDFDVEKKDMEEEDWEKAGPASSKPSPRRRASSRERESRENKRSDSRERASGGGRRISRSPGRRSDGLSSSSNSVVDKSRQPGKMISVPALEKGNTTTTTTTITATTTTNVVVEDGGRLRRRKDPALSSAGGALRSSSPRSRSPATIRASNENFNPTQKPQILSRSSSKKTEHSPYRRNPMVEIDDNSLPTDQNSSRSNPPFGDNQKASKMDGTKNQLNQKAPISNPHSHRIKNEHRRSKSGGGFEIPNGSTNTTVTRVVREQGASYRAKELEVVDDAVHEKVASVLKSASETNETSIRTITRTRSSRRSSRDLDALIGFNPDTHLNPNSYTSLLLEDIQNYHQQTTGFSLPACVSKACSILDAVADLNSAAYSGNNMIGHPSNNENYSSSTGKKDGILESEVVVKDDLMEPSLHKYVSNLRLGEEKNRKIGGGGTMGLELAPEESAGSNSFIMGSQPWSSSTREPSVDSSDYCWTSSLSNNNNNGGEGIEHSSASPWSDDHPKQHNHHHKKQLQQQQKTSLSETTAARRMKQKNVSANVISGTISGSCKKKNETVV